MEEVMVRFGELATKSEPVRRIFKSKLISNLKKRIENQGLKGKIRSIRGRIFIETSQVKEAAEIASKTFGVVSASPCIKVSRDYSEIKKTVLKLTGRFQDKERFRIRARRSDKSYRLTSKELEEKLGAAVLEEYDFGVDLEEPDFTIYVEVRRGDAYVFYKKIEGVGGLPEGVEGKAAAIIEGKNGILASWLMMKRGVEIVPLLKKKDQIGLLNKWSAFELDSVVIEGRIKDIPKGAKAFVSGRTLSNESDLTKLKQLKKELKLPVLFPLIGYTQGELKELYEKLKEA